LTGKTVSKSLHDQALEGQEGRKDRDKALETLRLRYAKGELDEETFRQLKRELEGGKA
jgi:putative membrane protein